MSDLLLAEPQVYGDLLAAGPDPTFGALLTELEAHVPRKRAEVMAQLRASKRRVALLAALADLAELWQVEEVTRALTQFADRAVQCALESALFEAIQRGDLDLELDGGTRLQERSGLFVIGMGKLGAFELNYSSDIDVIVLFDPERFRTRGREAPMALAVRLTRALVYLLEHRNRDGYVFRTDLRLRPHPPGHPLALAAEDAEQYYERHGQNWERAALIKAR
ncbi:MAG: glutamine-synthetase adenylyltransferase, partial [Nitrospirota bacterium]|nr:glutamine-synthetase adenylyltransferase [Nitrospirota bacterium]